eukprot:jgi/Bigna1/67108/fgenesh1_pg.3_\
MNTTPPFNRDVMKTKIGRGEGLEESTTVTVDTRIIESSLPPSSSKLSSKVKGYGSVIINPSLLSGAKLSLQSEAAKSEARLSLRKRTLDPLRIREDPSSSSDSKSQYESSQPDDEDSAEMSDLVSPRSLNQVVVEPLSLVYNVNQGHQINVIKEIKICNWSQEQTRFRVRTNSPDNHFIKPKFGVLQAKSTARIRVLTQAAAGQFPRNAKLLVQITVPNDREGQLKHPTFWRRIKVDRRKVLDTYISCKWINDSYLSPPSGPQPSNEIQAAKGGSSGPISPLRLKTSIKNNLPSLEINHPPSPILNHPKSPASNNQLKEGKGGDSNNSPKLPSKVTNGSSNVSHRKAPSRLLPQNHSPPHQQQQQVIRQGKLPSVVSALSSPNSTSSKIRTSHPPRATRKLRPSKRRSKTHHHDSIIIHPHVLRFLNDSTPSQWSKKLTITNTNKLFCAFKIKTNAPNHHLVVPHCGFIAPGQKANVHVSVRGVNARSSRYQHRILVMWTHVDRGPSFETQNPINFWNDANRSYEWEDLVIPCEWQKIDSNLNRVPQVKVGRNSSFLKPRQRSIPEVPARDATLIVSPVRVNFDSNAMTPQKHVISLKNIGNKDLAFRVSVSKKYVIVHPSEGFISTGTKSRLVVIIQPITAEMEEKKQINGELQASIGLETAEITLEQLKKFDPSEFWEQAKPEVSFQTAIRCTNVLQAKSDTKNDSGPKKKEDLSPKSQWWEITSRLSFKKKSTNNFTRDKEILRTWQVTKLIKREPIPMPLRAKIWSVSSGASEIRKNHGEDYYQELLAQAREKKDHPEYLEMFREIRQDIRRSLPSVLGSTGRRKLSNVLKAYCMRNPNAIGYCQGMNVIAGGLITACGDEEDAFWLLTRVVEDMAEGCYTRYMAGMSLYIKVFERLLMYTLPDLSRMLEQKGVIPSSFASQWMLCLFMSNPFKRLQALDLWDFYFLHGPNVLFTIGIGLLRFHKERLIRAGRDDLLDFILHNITEGVDIRDLLIHADMLQMDKWVKTLQKSYEKDIVRQHSKLSFGLCEQLARQAGIGDDKTDFVQKIWSNFLEPEPRLTLFKSVVTDLGNFSRAFCESVLSNKNKAWDHALISGVVHRLFDMMDIFNCNSIRFIDFLKVIAVLKLGTNGQKMKLCFDFFDKKQRGYVSGDVLVETLGMFHMMYGMPASKKAAQQSGSGEYSNNSDTPFPPSSSVRHHEPSHSVLADPETFALMMFEKLRKMVRPAKIEQKFIATTTSRPCTMCKKQCKRICKAVFAPTCGSECCDLFIKSTKRQLGKKGSIDGQLSFEPFSAVICTHPMVQSFFSLEDPSLVFRRKGD